MYRFFSLIICIFILLIKTSKNSAFDLKVSNILRDERCAISIKVENSGKDRIDSRLIRAMSLKVTGQLRCDNKIREEFKKFLVLPNFLVIPDYETTIRTGLSIDTSNGCKANIIAEIYKDDTPLVDDNLINNLYYRDFSGPCDIFIIN
ncbi:MAG: hypothetical protein SVN78_06165 [Deferribacterota bacterium]|nr:hypothetical protein [Deferribacterota bacterium]